MKKLTRILFLSCLKATELIEKKLQFKLSFKEKLQLKVHKMMCTACTNYENQSVLIDKSFENEQKIHDHQIDLENFKKSIVDKLNT